MQDPWSPAPAQKFPPSFRLLCTVACISLGCPPGLTSHLHLPQQSSPTSVKSTPRRPRQNGHPSPPASSLTSGQPPSPAAASPPPELKLHRLSPGRRRQPPPCSPTCTHTSSPFSLPPLLSLGGSHSLFCVLNPFHQLHLTLSCYCPLTSCLPARRGASQGQSLITSYSRLIPSSPNQVRHVVCGQEMSIKQTTRSIADMPTVPVMLRWDLQTQTLKASGHAPGPSSASPETTPLQCLTSYFLSVELPPRHENIPREAPESAGSWPGHCQSRASPFQELFLHQSPKHSEAFEDVLQYYL